MSMHITLNHIYINVLTTKRYIIVIYIYVDWVRGQTIY